MKNHWEQDRLGYRAIGGTFTNLIKSVDSATVISIEAGFGRGKTFFRKAWARDLEEAGEVVVQIDVQQSDHSGDPIVTLLGALVDAIPKKQSDKGTRAIESAKRLGAVGARSVARIALRQGADELIEAVTSSAIDRIDSFDSLDKFVNEIGAGMSKAAGEFIAAQLAAEKVRKDELPTQLKALHAALLEGKDSSRVVIIIDELDRCHPDYAIAVLEAMKLVFNQSLFVFCLMVNADYLERLAQHRFGVSSGDERYMDKFVDLRLRLGPQDQAFRDAIVELALKFPLKVPYAEDDLFSVNCAAELAGKLAVHCGFSMRKTKRILLRVNVALRFYSDRPLDAPLLVFLAFRDEAGDKVTADFLPRSFLSPQEAESRLSRRASGNLRSIEDERISDQELTGLIHDNAPELLRLPDERYQLPDDRNYKGWAKVLKYLAPHYIPSHRDALDAVASIVAPGGD